MNRSRRNWSGSLILALVVNYSPSIQACIGPDDKAVSLEQLQAMASDDDDDAKYALGRAYLKGDCVERDYNKAADIIYPLALHNHVEAQYQLGLMFLNGQGVSHSGFLAVHWMTEASKNGHKQAREFLKYMLNVGFSEEC